MKVKITPKAQRDLEAIGDHIALDNPVRAETFVTELLDRCDSLSDFPERFPLVERFGRSALRKCVHGNYLIFYRIKAKRVLVVHILHGATDYGSLLG